MFHQFADPQGWADFRMFVETASASRALGNVTREAESPDRETIGAILRHARERGEIHEDAEPRVIAELVYGAALLFALGRRLDHLEPPDEELSARIDVGATMLLASPR